MKKLTAMHLNQLALSVHLGWPTAERRKKQTIWLDIHLRFAKPPKACVTDQLDDTVCYDHLTRAIKKMVENKPFRLIEHCAADIYDCVKKNIKQAKIAIALTKKPPIPHLQSACFYYGDF